MSGPAPAEAAWRGFLERFPGTSTVDLILPDLAGVPRGKRFTAEAFAAATEGGLAFATSLYGMDTTGTNVAASGLIWEEGDADRPCVLDWSTLTPVPWRDGGAQIIGGLGEPDGTAYFADPRAVLRRVAARFEPLGLLPVAALELEFYLVDPASIAEGRLRPPRPAGGVRPSEVQVYSLDDLDDQAPFLERLGHYCAAQGLPAKSAVAEYAPGQYEVNLGHVGDPVQAADHAFLLKRAVKAAARAAGFEATFMAKPFADRSANGMHVHLSLLDRAGANRFAADAQALRHAVGGLRATMAEAMLIFVPNANSFRRLRPGSYAPLAPTWGYNNRTVALRIPAGGAAARRIEHRAPGSDANPYLVLAAILAGVHHGLEQGLDPGPPSEGNAYVTAPPSLARTWEQAIEAMAAAAVLPEYLGARFSDVYRACRTAERDRFSDVITPTEYHWYLRVV